MVSNLLKKINKKEESIEDIKMMSPIVLAYIGDVIYEVFIRTYVVKNNVKNVNKLHKISTMFVKASGQALAIKKLQEELNEDEKAIVRRGRNNKSATVPKNAKIMDYKLATGFEALIGYLYLVNDIERLEYIVDKAICIIEENEGLG